MVLIQQWRIRKARHRLTWHQWVNLVKIILDSFAADPILQCMYIRYFFTSAMKMLKKYEESNKPNSFNFCLIAVLYWTKEIMKNLIPLHPLENCSMVMQHFQNLWVPDKWGNIYSFFQAEDVRALLADAMPMITLPPVLPKIPSGSLASSASSSSK